MKIAYGNDCRVTVKHVVPCAIVRTRDGLRIDRNHPHAKELTEIVFDMMDNVKLLDADDEKGLKLLNRVAELSSKDAANELTLAWYDMLIREREAEAKLEAAVWVSQWAALEPEKRPDINEALATALCEAGNEALSARNNGGLRAVFAYGYQRGKEDAEASVADKG